MTKVQTIAVILALIFSVTAVAHSQQTARGANKIEPLPRDLEIQLALSALPPHLRDNATVYVLNPDKGFEVARKGTNGFHAWSLEPATIRSAALGPSQNIEMIFSTRFPLMKRAPRHKCGSSSMPQRCRLKALLLKN